MATETGTATDYRDLLQKLKLFLTGFNVSPASGLNWEVMEERSKFTSPETAIPVGDADELQSTPANADQTHDQIIFRGTGGVSPERDVYFALYTLGSSITSFYNWQIRGLTGFAQNSPITDYVPLTDQPGRSPPAYITLQNTTMTYWFMANDRHIKGCVKTGSAYQPFYIGFINPFATEAEYPYPMVIMGTYYAENKIFSSNDVGLSGLLSPGGDSQTALAVQSDPFPVVDSNGWVRFVDGNWYSVKHFFASGGSESALGSGPGICHIHPMAPTVDTLAPDGNKIVNENSIFQDFRNTTPGGAAEKHMLQALGSPRMTTLWPLTLYLVDQNQLLGEFDGCYWAPGAGGVTSEDTITDFGVSPEVEHIIFQNTWKTDPWQFLAIRND